ncbi:MAG: hypothetical protein J1D88_10215, partial [Treponema sp.]|nr:hypothetical protein [Treponema sp.]
DASRGLGRQTRFQPVHTKRAQRSAKNEQIRKRRPPAGQRRDRRCRMAQNNKNFRIAAKNHPSNFYFKQKASKERLLVGFFRKTPAPCRARQISPHTLLYAKHERHRLKKTKPPTSPFHHKQQQKTMEKKARFKKNRKPAQK